MINEVRIYNANMKLVSVVTPELTFENMKKFQPHICRHGGCGKTTTNRHYCSADCRVAVKAKQEKAKRVAKAKIEDAKPKIDCTNLGCPEKLASRQSKYCSKKCAAQAGIGTRRAEAEISKQKLKELRENGNYQQ